MDKQIIYMHGINRDALYYASHIPKLMSFRVCMCTLISQITHSCMHSVWRMQEKWLELGSVGGG